MKCKEYNHCRLCYSDKIQVILDFGETALANSFVKDKIPQNEFTAPLQVFLCYNCGSVQLKHTVDPELLFTNYLYESSTSATFRQHFQKYATELLSNFAFRKNDLVCDIGSNDGILLKPLMAVEHLRALGIEPASNLAKIANDNGVETVNNFFSLNLVDNLVKVYGQARFITANNVFAHIDDLHDIVEGVKKFLLDDGVFVFENAYLLDTIQNMYFDQVYSEHIYYHSLTPLVQLFEAHNMTIFHVARNNIQGGTIRVYVKKKNGPHKLRSSVKELLNQEKWLLDPGTYEHFKNNLKKLAENLHDVLRKYNNVCAYGAPAKFTTFCKVMGCDNKTFRYVVDDALLKQGLYTPGTHIPVISKEEFNKDPAEACVVTAWNFANGIIANNKTYKGKWIIPLPEIKEI